MDLRTLINKGCWVRKTRLVRSAVSEWATLICRQIAAQDIGETARLLSQALGIRMEMRRSVNYANPYYFWRMGREEIFIRVNEDEEGEPIKDDFPLDAIFVEAIDVVGPGNAHRARQMEEAVKWVESQHC
jgi:hypothetical protein